jgi:FAD/FMN-containing dehydrogenase
MATMLDDNLSALFPVGSLVTDAEECAFYAQDVHSVGAAPCAVFRPADIDELSNGLAAAHARGLAILPRGGGMSYTRGYLADPTRRARSSSTLAAWTASCPSIPSTWS